MGARLTSIQLGAGSGLQLATLDPGGWAWWVGEKCRVHRKHSLEAPGKVVANSLGELEHSKLGSLFVVFQNSEGQHVEHVKRHAQHPAVSRDGTRVPGWTRMTDRIMPMLLFLER